MSPYKPTSEERLLDLINETSGNLSEQEYRFYQSIWVPPQKWRLNPWANGIGGFWVIGIIGKTVLWYNEIEDGFNYSTYPKLGDIGEYWCDQDEFDLAIRRLNAFIQTGVANIKCGAPRPIA